MILEIITNVETGEVTVIEGPDLPPTLDDYRRAIDNRVEEVARLTGYNGAAYLATYVNSTNATWAAEAAAFVSWRDAVWKYAIGIMSDWQLGNIPAPPLEEVLLGLPVPEWLEIP